MISSHFYKPLGCTLSWTLFLILVLLGVIPSSEAKSIDLAIRLSSLTRMSES
jgi:hypothetical protein